jgi:hypothetical protein
VPLDWAPVGKGDAPQRVLSGRRWNEVGWLQMMRAPRREVEMKKVGRKNDKTFSVGPSRTPQRLVGF